MTRIVFLHGFLGAPDQLASVAPSAVGVRLPGHGEAPWFPVVDGFVPAVDALAERVVLAAGGPASVLVGYSMGARLALSMLLRHPRVARAAVLVGVDPGFADEEARLARAAVEEERARRVRDGGLAAFVEAWEREPIFGTQRALDPAVLAAQRAARAAHSARGIAWALDHLGSARQPLLDVGDLDAPITFMAGERDARFAAIATDLAREAPHGRVVIAPGAGHNLLLEAPDLVRDEIRRLASALDLASPTHEGTTP